MGEEGEGRERERGRGKGERVVVVVWGKDRKRGEGHCARFGGWCAVWHVDSSPSPRRLHLKSDAATNCEHLELHPVVPNPRVKRVQVWN